MSKCNLKICFFFPYHVTSGVPVLFSRMANEIAQHNSDIDIYVIDYGNGAMSRNLMNYSNIKLLPFYDGVSISPPEDAVLVMQSILPYSIRPELVILPNTRLVFWNLHPDCLIPSLIPFPYFRNFQNKNFKFYSFLARTLFKTLVFKLSDFVDFAIKKKALWFMDQTNLNKTKKYLFTNIPDVDFVPVPALGSSVIKDPITTKKDIVNFTWVGRLCDFKSYILIYTINKLSALAFKHKKKIQYTIIGDGPFKNKLSDLDVNHNWFRLEILGSLKLNVLDSYLLENTDVLTAMGTSALEGAKFGIPTILLDISYFPVKGDYIFKWLHETKNYDLGHDITKLDIQEGNLSLNIMFDDILFNYNILSKKTIDYFINNHEMKTVMDKFILKVKESEMKFSDINPSLFNKNLIRKSYDSLRYKRKSYVKK